VRTMSDTTARASRSPRALLDRWPSLLGVVLAVLVVLGGADRENIGIIVAAATVCYLAGAAMGRPWAAVAAIPGSVVVTVGGGLLQVNPLVSLAVVAVVLVGVGFAIRVSRAALTVQSLGVLLYGCLVVVGFAIDATAGLVLVALTLIGHGAWDIWHLRRGAVVPRPLAEGCLTFDVLIGLAALAILLVT
jgi:hypothetical protein